MKRRFQCERLGHWLIGCLLLAAVQAHAHLAGTSWLTLHADAPATLQFDLPLRDLDVAIGLDRDADAAITWGELRAARPALEAYVLARLSISADGRPCRVQPHDLLFNARNDGAYASLQAGVSCSATRTQQFVVTSRVLQDADSLHKTVVTLKTVTGAPSGVLAGDRPVVQLERHAVTPWHEILTFVQEGVWHIWQGYDHLLFVFTLLLPAVLVRCEGRWVPISDVRSCVRRVAWTITAFTVAHSLTLALATTGLLQLPGRLVEAAIAASVVVVALNNVWPLLTRDRSALPFVFGLVHGCGLASTLSDLELPRTSLLLALGGFNMGVELGQMALVLLVLPLLLYLRHWRLYPVATLRLGSLLIAVAGALWCAERLFNLQLLPAAA